ncbi:MAG: hypothetical protein AAF602_28450 [Myxococcota bacterium]
MDSESLVLQARRLGDATETRRLDFMRYTREQQRYLSVAELIALWRGGNQIGKSTGTLVDLIHTCRGTHPFRPVAHRPPVSAVVLSESWEQMGQTGGFMEKLWQLLPKHEIDPKIRFDPGRGITGKPPRVVFTSGPGKGSVITLATYRQGAKRIAGGTVHYVLMDEPGPPELYQEIIPRLMRHRGLLRINFTPVLNMPDQTHLRNLVAEGEIHEVHSVLEEANCWPEGLPAPWIDQASIDARTRTLPAAVRAMRVEGAWDPVRDERWLTNWNAERHVVEHHCPAGAWLAVGIDHGTNAGKQHASLIGIVDRRGLRPYAFAIDEAPTEGLSDAAQDARAILRMLSRHNLSWRDIDVWVGDRPTNMSRHLVRKSNASLRRQLAFQSKVELRAFPQIQTPKKYAGSVEHGLWLMNTLLGDFDADGTPHFQIHPRCEGLIQFCDQFDGHPDDPVKDAGDSFRYPLEVGIGVHPAMRMVARY